MKKKIFKDLTKLREKYYTTEELFEFLKSYGYSSSISTLMHWERKGIIPQPKRIEVRKGVFWRVYDKTGKDFEKILKTLKNRKQRIVILK